MSGQVNPSFWTGKKVFLTGHTGFKGGWLSLWMQSMGSRVKGYALQPPTTPALFEVANVGLGMESEIGDIRDLEKLKSSLSAFNPDIVIHMAAQPLVRDSYLDPIETYSTNVIGTANVLEAVRLCDTVGAVVSVTTDKCYENKEWPWGYRENEPMGGYDPYSSSKGCAELVTAAYRRSFFSQEDSPAVASARAGNVIGGGDWAKDRLIPDVLRAFDQNEAVIIRNPMATRPWQHVLEPLSGYLVLAEKLYEEGAAYAEGWNFGPKDEDCKPVEWMLNTIIEHWDQPASWQLDQNANPHEATFLKLDCSKAAFRLRWEPRWHVKTAIEKVVNWHLAWKAGDNMQQYCLNEIKTYHGESKYRYTDRS